MFAIIWVDCCSAKHDFGCALVVLHNWRCIYRDTLGINALGRVGVAVAVAVVDVVVGGGGGGGGGGGDGVFSVCYCLH